MTSSIILFQIIILQLLTFLACCQNEQSFPLCSNRASRGPCGCPPGTYCDISQPSEEGPPSLFCCSPCEDGSLALFLSGPCPGPPGSAGSGQCGDDRYQCQSNGACCRRRTGPPEPTGICGSLNELPFDCRRQRCPGEFFCKRVGRISRCCKIPEAPACPFSFNSDVYPVENCGDISGSLCPAGFYCVTENTGYAGRCCPDPFLLGLIENPCWYGQPSLPPQICEAYTSTCPDPYNYCEALPNNNTVGVCCVYSDAIYNLNCPIGLPLLDVECDKSEKESSCAQGFSCVQEWKYDIGACCANIFSYGIVENPCPVDNPVDGVFCDYDQQCPFSHNCVEVPGRYFGVCCLESRTSHTTELTIDGKTLICPDECPRYYYSPVCGSDSITYSNQCYLMQAACLNRDSSLTTKHPGNCLS